MKARFIPVVLWVLVTVTVCWTKTPQPQNGIPAGKKCAICSEHCEEGTVCDSSSKTCRIKVGEYCSSELCVTGATCNVGTCRVLIGQPCSSGECVTGAFCVNGLCGIKVGEYCNSELCVPGATCDDGTCRIPVGEYCCSELCVTGATCEGGTCRIPVGEACSSEQCVTRATCDGGTCRVSVDQPCSSEECVTGASCDNGFCVFCKSDTYTVLDDPMRSTEQKLTDPKTSLSDRHLTPGWYRFLLNGLNAVMPTQCVKKYHCNTRKPQWLNLRGGSLPGPGLQTLFQSCASWSTCCSWGYPIMVRNCGLFYIYELSPRPVDNMAHCVEPQQ